MHYVPEALLSIFSKEFRLETAALVEEDSGNQDMDSYLGVFLLLSFYEEDHIKQKENFYDVEVFCKETDVEFYEDGKFMCAVPASSDIKSDICKILIQTLS